MTIWKLISHEPLCTLICLYYHPLVILSIYGDRCLFDDSVCDLMEVTERHPVFGGLFISVVLLFPIQPVLL